MNYSDILTLARSFTLDQALTAAGDAAATPVTAGAADVSATDVSFMEACLGGGGWKVLLLYAVILLVCYLLLLRPQKKRREQEEQLRKSVVVGDEITTIGGLCGRIVSIKEDDTLVIETSGDRSKIKIKSWAIQSNDTARERIESEPKEEKQGLFAKLFGKKDDVVVSKNDDNK